MEFKLGSQACWNVWLISMKLIKLLRINQLTRSSNYLLSSKKRVPINVMILLTVYYSLFDLRVDCIWERTLLSSPWIFTTVFCYSCITIWVSKLPKVNVLEGERVCACVRVRNRERENYVWTRFLSRIRAWWERQ